MATLNGVFYDVVNEVTDIDPTSERIVVITTIFVTLPHTNERRLMSMESRTVLIYGLGALLAPPALRPEPGEPLNAPRPIPTPTPLASAPLDAPVLTGAEHASLQAFTAVAGGLADVLKRLPQQGTTNPDPASPAPTLSDPIFPEGGH